MGSVSLSGAANTYGTVTQSALKPSAGTLELWFKASAATTAPITCRGSTTSAYGITVSVRNDWKLEIVFGNNSIYSFITSTDVLSSGTWYHVAVTWDNTAHQIKAYLNGVQFGGTQAYDIGWGIGFVGYEWQVGRWTIGGTSYDFSGYIDELRIWNVARTQTQIADNRYPTIPTNSSGLVGYWKLDESSGLTGYDATSNGYNLTFNSGTTWSSDAPVGSNPQGYSVPVGNIAVEGLAPTWLPIIYRIPSGDLAVQGLAPTWLPITYRIPAGNLAVQGLPPTVRQYWLAPVAAVAVQALAPLMRQHWLPPAGTIAVEGLAPTRYYLVTRPTTGLIQVQALTPAAQWTQPTAGRKLYRCVLTGAPDGLADLVLPISSLNVRARSGDPTYVQVVVPDAWRYGDGIAARTNGDLILYVGFPDLGLSEVELARAHLERVADDRGGQSASVTLSGHQTVTNASPQTRTVRGVSYRHTGTGERRYRAALDLWVRPGDTAQFPELAESIVVGSVVYSVTPAGELTELVEAAT